MVQDNVPKIIAWAVVQNEILEFNIISDSIDKLEAFKDKL